MKKSFIILFLLIPCILLSVILITPDKDISQNENRTLMTKNSISLSNIQNDLESYLCEQFVFRDLIISLKTELCYIAGKRDINGCYMSKDRLIQKITDSDIDVAACEKYAEKINNIAKDIDTYVMYVPSSSTMLKNSLPKNAVSYDYDALYNNLSSRLENAEIIDIKKALRSEDAYYITDHHWTASGAYSAYKLWCDATLTTPQSFEFEKVTDKFHGTLYSKAPFLNYPFDVIEAPVIKDDITVTADGSCIDLYDESALKTKDKYNYFEGGNHGILTIENNSVKNGKVLMILKDSFANSFVVYLINHYEKIIMIDERYTFLSPADIIKSENVNQVLVLKEITA